MGEHFSADGYPVKVGARFWDNDLRVTEIRVVAAWSNPYADTGETQTWHESTEGAFDTLSGSLRWIGRLARYYGGQDAELFGPGTRYREDQIGERK